MKTTTDVPLRPNGLPHLSECLQMVYPDEAKLDPEEYPCTCDDYSPEWSIG